MDKPAVEPFLNRLLTKPQGGGAEMITAIYDRETTVAFVPRRAEA